MAAPANGTGDDKSVQIAILAWQDFGPIISDVIGSSQAGQQNVGGCVGRSLLAAGLDVGKSGLFGSDAAAVSGLIGSITGTASTNTAAEILQNLAVLQQMCSTIIQLDTQIENQLAQIDAKLDAIAGLIKWTYALGATNPYASAVQTAVQDWKLAKADDQADGTPTASQTALAQQFLDSSADGLQNQLLLFYQGTLGLSVAGQNPDLALVELSLQQSWDALAATDLKSWFDNACTLIGKVKSLLLEGMHAVLWALEVANPAEVDGLTTQYQGWITAFDSFVEARIPTVLLPLFAPDRYDYTFSIQNQQATNPYYDHQPITATDSFVENGDTLQRLVFPSAFNGDGTANASWVSPPQLSGALASLGTGTIANAVARTRMKLAWDTDAFTFKVGKDQAAKLSADEPPMFLALYSQSYTINAYPSAYSFTQSDAVLTTGAPASLRLVPIGQWDSRNTWQIQDTVTGLPMNTAGVHGTGGVFSIDPSQGAVRFGTNAMFADGVNWGFNVVAP